jgi:CoA:oxalate CoA-transferase
MASYISRLKTGEGQHIELSLLECASTMLLCGIPAQTACGEPMERIGNADRFVAPGNSYRSKDGKYILLIAGTQQHFRRLCRAMHQDELLNHPRFKTPERRLQNRKAIDKIVADWVKEFSSKELGEILNKHGLVIAEVETVKDLVENPQLHYQRKFVDLYHPVMGNMTMLGAPYSFSGMELDLSRPCPTLGQHNEEVLKDWLNMNDQEIESLKRNRAITV